MSAPAPLRRERIAAFVGWLNTVDHPHWEQPGFDTFADLSRAERLEAARILEAQADAHFAHADKLEGEVQRRVAERSGAAPPESESPPAATEGQRIAVGASAKDALRQSAAGSNVIPIPRLLVECIAHSLIDVLDRADGDADCEDAEPDNDDGDSEDAARLEWDRVAACYRRGASIAAGHEDAEDDDPAGVHDEDGANTFLGHAGNGPGCPIADPGGCEHDGREDSL